MSMWKHIILVILAIICVGCKISFGNGDDEPRLPETPTDTPNAPTMVIAQSIAQDSTVNAEDVTSVTLTYSSKISIEQPNQITINDRVAIGASTTDCTLTIPLALEPNTHYTLIVKSDALSADDGGNIVTFTLNFTTRATVNINNVATELCTSNPTNEATQLYNHLRSVYGEKSLAGITENNINENEFSWTIQSITGKTPALICYDFKDIHTIDYNAMPAVTAHHEAGGIVGFTWTWLVPSNENSNSADFSADNDFSIANALNRTTWESRFIENELDIVASHLKSLKDAGIPILFDPMHVAQSHWWSKKGANYFRELWKLIYDRLVVKHGLNNLIWVWTTDSENLTDEELKEWYPGDKYCDIIGTAIYADDTDSQIERFLLLNRAFEGKKMIAITECGNIPDIKSCHAAGDTWLYFTVNSASSQYNHYKHNTEAHWSNTLNSPFVITLP